MAKSLRISTLIPHLFAFTIAVVFVVHDYVFLEATAALGRPSSTFAIGYFFLPIYALLFWLISYIPGYAIRFLLRKFNLDRSIAYTQQLLLALCTTLILSAIAGYFAYQGVVATAAKQTPRVISNQGQFESLPSLPDDVNRVRQGAQLQRKANGFAPLNWHGQALAVALSDNQLRLDFPTKRLVYDFSDYTYVSDIKTLTTPQWLVVLVKLRPTSGLSMLLIYNQKGQLAYEELLSRCDAKQNMTLYRDTASYLLKVSACDQERILHLDNRYRDIAHNDAVN